MNVQDSVNQILGMAMIGGKLTGIPDKLQANRAKKKEIADVQGKIDAVSAINAEKVQDAKEMQAAIHEGRTGPKKVPGMITKAEEDLYEHNQGLLTMQEGELKLRQKMYDLDTTVDNANNVIAATKSVEATKSAISGHLKRKQAMEESMKRETEKPKVPGGKPDGK